MTKILLVEDDKKLALLIQSYLEQRGYQVEHEINGDKAVYRIVKQQPDLVLLDVMLPGLSGLQVCQAVRSNYHGMILIMTALDNDETQVQGLSTGADDYITKPIVPQVLVARIEALLRRSRSAITVNVLKFGDLEINLINRTVTLKQQQITLKPKEFELLVFLATNADKIVSRDNIMQALRGTEYDGIDRTIDLRISYLRKKLDDNVLNPYRIKTIRSRGYLFISNAWHK